jgi:hypothetical protein
MRKIDVKSRQQNQELPIKFTAKNIIAILNFFFNQIIRVGGVGYLASLISYYSYHPKGKADRGVGIRADDLFTDNVDRPQIIRDFFSKVVR